MTGTRSRQVSVFGGISMVRPGSIPWARARDQRQGAAWPTETTDVRPSTLMSTQSSPGVPEYQKEIRMRGAVIALTAVIVGVSVRTADASFGTRDQIPAPTDVENVIQVWLECDECTGGELQAVVTLGPKAVPILASMLQKGPAKERLDAQRKHLLKRYGSLRDYQKTH